MNKTMKKILVAGLACAAFCGTTFAAPHGGRDPMKAPVHHQAPRHPAPVRHAPPRAVHVVHHDHCGGTAAVAVGAIIGAAIMGVLRNGLVLLDVSAYWQQTVIGAVIILAVALDNLRHMKKKA